MMEVVPSGIQISVQGDMLVFRSDFGTGSSGSYACRWLYEGSGHQSELVRDACWHAFRDRFAQLGGDGTNLVLANATPVGAATTIVRSVLRGTLDTQPASDAKAAAHPEAASKSQHASVDSLSPADRLPAWRGARLRGTL